MSDLLSEALRSREEQEEEERKAKAREMAKAICYCTYRYQVDDIFRTKEELAGAIVAAGEASWAEMSEALAKDDTTIFRAEECVVFQGKIYRWDHYGMSAIQKIGLDHELSRLPIPKNVTGAMLEILKWSQAKDAILYWLQLDIRHQF